MVSDEEWARVARSATLRARGRIFCAVGAGVGTLSPRADVLEAARAAARAGREVERMIVLADPARAHTPDVRELVELDADAGICVRFVDAAGALLSRVL